MVQQNQYAIEQNKDVKLNEIRILVRKSSKEKTEDLFALNQLIGNWKTLVVRRRVKRIIVKSYEFEPTQYYGIVGEVLAFDGRVRPDEMKPTGTNVDYTPRITSADSKEGQEQINRLIEQFDEIFAQGTLLEDSSL